MKFILVLILSLSGCVIFEREGGFTREYTVFGND